MSILFSPVGTADPFTQLGDGPLIHIVRHKRPDKVVLFLSPLMAKYQKQDERYTQAIKMLCTQLGVEAPEVRIVESAYEDVFRFDWYIEEFELLLKECCAEDKTVFVNATSGTAGMQQALVALGSFGRLDITILQVTTPRNDANTRDDREDPRSFDLETLWEFSQEIEAGAPCRIIEVETPNFSEQLLRETIITLIRSYDYEAAYELAKQSKMIDDATEEMIHAAADRLCLKGQLPAKVFGGTELCYKQNDALAEYLYMMEVRLKQGHWADFIKSLSPAFVAIVKTVLAPYLPETRYTLVENGRPTGKYNVSAIAADPRLRKVFSNQKDLVDSRGAERYITSEAYFRLVEEYCEDASILDDIRKLRHAESRCRNKLAHEIRDASKERIEKDCNMPLARVMEILFQLHGNAKPGMFDKINEMIISRLY